MEDESTQGARKPLLDSEQKWTCSRFLTLLGLAAAQFFSYTSVFILSSFFPPLAEEKQISGVELGLIVGIIQGIFTVAAYIFVQKTHIVSPKSQVVAGLVLTGVCTSAFGVLNQVPDGIPFFFACFVVRIFQGIGIAASDVSVLFIANQVIPPKLIGTVIGILEFSLEEAIAFSSPIGGYLYEADGFYLPFLMSGLTTLACAGFCFFVLPSSGCIEKLDFKTILKNSINFEMLVYITHFTLQGLFSGFFAGIIEPHLRQFDLPPGQTGLIILITSAICGLMFPVWGIITDKTGATNAITILGGLLTATGFIFFGPFPGLPTDNMLLMVCGSLVLCGVGMSAVLISSYKAAGKHLISTCDNEEIANAVLSSNYPSMYNIGAFLGAILGGIFVDSIGFRLGSAILFALQLLGVVLHLVLLARRRISTRVN